MALHRPKHQALIPADAEQMKTLDQFQREPLVSLFLEPDPRRDMIVPLSNGEVLHVCESVTINGIRFDLNPGENRLPRTVYEFFMQCPDQRRRVTSPQANAFQCLGKLG